MTAKRVKATICPTKRMVKRHSIWWFAAAAHCEDLTRRMRGSKALADMTFASLERSPDHIGSLVTGSRWIRMRSSNLRPGCGENLMRYYEHVRDNDIYLSYAVDAALRTAKQRGPHQA